MKKTKLIAAFGSVAIVALSVFLIAADHIDAPAVEGTKSDITDLYAFEGDNPNNLVFALGTQGLIAPENTGNASFDENVLQEINIDTNNDLIEDLVIQAIKRSDTMYFFGPYIPNGTGVDSDINEAAMAGQVQISNAGESITATNNGMSFYAGPREDPFYFDFTQYNLILDGAATGFEDPGNDTFAGSNALYIVIELPKSMLGDGMTGVNPFAPDTPIYNVWAETKRKQ